MPYVVTLATAAAGKLSSIVTADMLNGVHAEIIGLLPVVIPVSVAWAGLRKGLGFLQSAIRRA